MKSLAQAAARIPKTPYGDTSAVLELAALDDFSRKSFDASKPWLFDNDEDGVVQFATEEEACAAQRAYRKENGFHEIEGHRVHPNGAPLFTKDGMMLDDQGNRSIFDDVDE